MMKVNILDAHDRLQHFTKQSFDIAECCKDMVDKRPFGQTPFYIFAHARTDEDGVTKRLIWQPRLTKPKSQTNSMLFKAYPGTDLIKVIWMIPDRCIWKNFSKGMLSENKMITESIYNFKFNREKLDMKEDDDLTDDQVNGIYTELSMQAKQDEMMKRIYDI